MLSYTSNRAVRHSVRVAHNALRHSSRLSFFQQKQLPMNTVVRFVPQQQAWIVERMGKFNRILDPGLAILIPFLDKIQYVQSLKETAVEVGSQSAITSDNVTLEMDGILYIRVYDAYKASYGVEDAEYAITQLAQTTMRSEIGQMTLDHVLRERQALNTNITTAINEAAKEWGVTCLRYEIRDIHPPRTVLDAMHKQVSAERTKRAEILESEGKRQEQINRAEGESEAIRMRAQATADGIRFVAEAINNTKGGADAVSLSVAEKYVDAFGKLAKESNTVVVPAQLSDMGGFIASGMGIYNQVTKQGLKGKAEKDAADKAAKVAEHAEHA